MHLIKPSPSLVTKRIRDPIHQTSYLSLRSGNRWRFFRGSFERARFSRGFRPLRSHRILDRRWRPIRSRIGRHHFQRGDVVPGAPRQGFVQTAMVDVSTEMAESSNRRRRVRGLRSRGARARIGFGRSGQHELNADREGHGSKSLEVSGGLWSSGSRRGFLPRWSLGSVSSSRFFRARRRRP